MSYPTVADVMEEGYDVVSMGDQLSKAAARLEGSGRGALLVLGDDGRYEGVLSERDVLRTTMDPSAAKVRSVFRRAPKVRPRDSVLRAARLMVENDARYLPVFSDDRIVGTVSDEAIIREAVKGKFGEVRVEEVMVRDPVMVEEGETIARAIAAMRQEGISRVPVVRGDRVVGVLSVRDVVEKVLRPMERATLGEVSGEKERPMENAVSTIMSRDLVTALPEDTVRRAAELMLENDVASVVVVDRAGRLKGLLTRTDLLRRLGELERPGPGIIVQLSVKDPDEFDNVEIDREKIASMFDAFARKYGSFLGPASITVFVKRQKGKRRGRRLTHCRVQVLSSNGFLVGVGEGWGLNQAIRVALDNLSRQVERRKEEGHAADRAAVEELLGLL